MLSQIVSDYKNSCILATLCCCEAKSWTNVKSSCEVDEMDEMDEKVPSHLPKVA